MYLAKLAMAVPEVLGYLLLVGNVCALGVLTSPAFGLGTGKLECGIPSYLWSRLLGAKRT